MNVHISVTTHKKVDSRIFILLKDQKKKKPESLRNLRTSGETSWQRKQPVTEGNGWFLLCKQYLWKIPTFKQNLLHRCTIFSYMVYVSVPKINVADCILVST